MADKFTAIRLTSSISSFRASPIKHPLLFTHLVSLSHYEHLSCDINSGTLVDDSSSLLGRASFRNQSRLYRHPPAIILIDYPPFDSFRCGY